MKTDYGHVVAEDAIILAENSDYCVWVSSNDWYFLSGLGRTRFVFTDENDWNRLTSVIIEATEKIEGSMRLTEPTVSKTETIALNPCP